MNHLQIEKKHLAKVTKILGDYDLTVFAFGSGVKGTAKKFSDLDLVCKSSIDKTTYRKIISAFEDSNIPYKIDFVLWNELSEDFQNHISKDLVKL